MVAFTKLTRKTAPETAEAVITKLSQYVAHTITFDNGSEFTQHGKITDTPVSYTHLTLPTSDLV